jgi:phthalate 4,5-cis-dihydrodiol dehydrogenase
MVNALNFTDFLYRPRRPEELDTRAGGGVVFSQAAHQIDIVRLLVGSKARSIRAFAGRWDPARGTEGAYNAQLSFEDGAFASLTYSGYAHFDTDEFNDWWGELGQRRDPDAYGHARSALQSMGSADEEIAMKNRRAYGPTGSEAFQTDTALAHNHFGLIVASCDGADLRPTPTGVIVYGDKQRWVEEIAAPTIPRAEVVDELYDAVVFGRAPLHSGEWGLATLEACLAILQSSAGGREVELKHQT